MAEAPVEEDTPHKEQESATPHASDPLPGPGAALWGRILKASVTAGAFLLLYSLSQLTVSLSTLQSTQIIQYMQITFIPAIFFSWLCV